MDLEEFVAETLRQIVSGVIRAQRDTHELGARIYPILNRLSGSSGRLVGEDAEAHMRDAYEIAFDVAVTASSSTGSNAGIKARLHVIEAGLGGNSTAENITASRVSFAIPVVFPVHSGGAARVGGCGEVTDV